MTTGQDSFSLAEFEVELGEAGLALQALADGPGQAASDALRNGFAAASEEIERALTNAAKSGELSFDALFKRILDDMARVAAEWAITASGIGSADARPAGSPLNLTFNLTGGSDAGSVLKNQGRIAQMLTGALRSGGRYQ